MLAESALDRVLNTILAAISGVRCHPWHRLGSADQAVPIIGGGRLHLRSFLTIVWRWSRQRLVAEASSAIHRSVPARSTQAANAISNAIGDIGRYSVT